VNGRRERANAEPVRAPSADVLREAALTYLARCAATAAGVARVLERRIDAWARKADRAGCDPETIQSEAARARDAIEPVVSRLREVGLIDDAAFAEARARSLSRAGRSRRAIAAHLAERGAAESVVRQALEVAGSSELGSAIAFAYKRKIGPFSRRNVAPRTREEVRTMDRKAFAAMARAGFDYGISERALRMDLDEAETLLAEHRRP